MVAEGPGFGATVPYHTWAAASVPSGETMWLGCCSWACGHWAETFFSIKLARVGPILLVQSSRGGKETSFCGAGRSCSKEKLLEDLLLLISAGWELTSVPGPCGTGTGHEVHRDRGRRHSLGWGHLVRTRWPSIPPQIFPCAWHPLSPFLPSSGPLYSLPLSSSSPLHPSWK